MALPGTLTLPLHQHHHHHHQHQPPLTAALMDGDRTDNPLLLAHLAGVGAGAGGASQSLVSMDGHSTLPSHASLQGPHSTSAVEMSNMVHPHSTFSHPTALGYHPPGMGVGMGAGGGYINTIPQVGQLMPILPDYSSSSSAMMAVSKSGHGQSGHGHLQGPVGGPSHLTDDHDHDHDTVGGQSKASARPDFTKNSNLEDDGDQKEEPDYSIPPPEWSATKTIIRFLRWLGGAIVGPIMAAGETVVYHERYGCIALYDRLVLCLFPPIDYDSMNPVLAAKVCALYQSHTVTI